MGNELSSNLPEDWATVDMVNRFTFCPRLFHLMYVEGRWEENEYTIEGKAIHRRVDRIDQILPETTEPAPAGQEEGDAPPEVARSVSLAADDLGLMGKLDLVSCDPEGGEAIPVETKRGRVPAVPLRSYPPERVQVMAQGLLLRRHGYQSDLQEQGARIGKTGERLTVTKDKEIIGDSRLIETSQVVLFGNVQISAQALHLLMEKGIPVIHFSTGAWFHGISHGTGIENAYSRAAQYASAADPLHCTRFTVPLIHAKIANQRALILRNGSGEAKDRCVRELAAQLKFFDPSGTFTRPIPPDTLRGWEGQAAASYFAAFSGMLKTGELPDFDFVNRNRRPPKDPVNALLSFTYALLVKECLVALWGEGLDPWWGLYHRPRHGRPALALDFMEPFRPIIADSVVITAINTGMVKPRDFITNSNGCAMQPAAKKALLRAWEQRLDQLHTHPEFGYRCSWRTILRIQARLLVRLLRGDIPHLPWPVVR